MLPIKFDDVSIASLQGLIDNGLHESKNLDFKRTTVGPRDEDKKNFLADVSALANTAGGDLIFGVEEHNGQATKLCGVDIKDPEAEKLRLEGILQGGLEPRLPNVVIKTFSEQSIICILIRVRQSFSAPHRVTFQKHSKFYGRNSSGNYAMDVSQLRQAFLASEGVVDSIKSFRKDRLEVIEKYEEPVLLSQGSPLLIIHILPLVSFSTAVEIQVGPEDQLQPLISSSGFSQRYTLEGFVTFSPAELMDGGDARAYTLLFRSGCVEAVAAQSFFSNIEQPEPYIHATSVERLLRENVGRYVNKLKLKQVEPPFYLCVSLLNIGGRYLKTENHFHEASIVRKKSALLIPETLIEDHMSTEQMVRPAIDFLWNAFGHAKSANYDNEGKYIGSSRW
jgi:hypothetical protein